MPSDKVKEIIKLDYQRLKNTLENFEPRAHQNYLVSEITKALSGDFNNTFICAEAGTGTGKSLGYLMSAIPVAAYSGKKVIISTATVALQEQLIEKDLPFYSNHIKPVSYTIAKGKGRYCCHVKLSNLISSDDEPALFSFMPEKDDISVLHKLSRDLESGKWDGDRDSLKQSIRNQLWDAIASDSHTCDSSEPHKECSVNKARANLMNADVIIANHSIVTADLALGGGIILPEPEETIYIFDEAHHLPIIVRDSTASSFSFNATSSILEAVMKNIRKNSNTYRLNFSKIDTIDKQMESMNQSLTFLQSHYSEFKFTDNCHRFKKGNITSPASEEHRNIKTQNNKIISQIKKIIDEIDENESMTDSVKSSLLPDLIFFKNRLSNVSDTSTLVSNEFEEKPTAKWLSVNDGNISINTSLLDPSVFLKENLFEKASGVVFTSATLSTLNNFDYFIKMSGIPEESHFVRLSSPFDYQNNAQLVIPQIRCNPNQDSFVDEIIEKLRSDLLMYRSTMVLFTSYQQMKQVAESILPTLNSNKIEFGMQGEGSRVDTINKHKSAIDNNRKSVIFGVQGYSEGIDLQRDYLTQLIIIKIPFSVPSNPIDEAFSEFIESKGGNSFKDISLPEASRKLIQCAGRLIRTKQDQGRCVIYDNRLKTKGYGQDLIDALPPFKCTIE